MKPQLGNVKSGPALIDPECNPEFGQIMKPATFSKTVLGLLLLLALLVALHIVCLIYNNGCSISVVTDGNFALQTDGHGTLCHRAGIHAFTIVSTIFNPASVSRGGILSREELSALRPFHGFRYVDDEHVVPSNLKLKKLWTSKNWRIKVSTFTDLFSDIMDKDLLKPCLKVLCIGAGQGHEVLALKEMGIYNSIGIDLVAAPPLVLKGDMHSQPFRRETFDFEYCNVFDHALFTSMFAEEIERTLKPGGYIAIHLMLKNRTQEAYRPSNLQNVGVLIALFRNFEFVQVGDIDAFGLDTEVIFRKPFSRKRLGLPT